MDLPIKKSLSVLLVDDSFDDRFFLRAAMHGFDRFAVRAELESGSEAIAYLKGDGIFRHRELYPLPDLMILDLKMPGVTGFEVLEWLKTNSFPSLTLVVHSGAGLNADKERCRLLGAHAYYTKSCLPSEVKMMLEECQALVDQRICSQRKKQIR